MALPKIDIPTFEATLPVLNKVVKYRPFLVKEHKVLMMLQESDSDGVSKIVADLVTACTFGKVDGSTLSSVDLEYLFLQIRAKSISETYNFIVTCGCGEQTEVQANIENIKVDKPEGHELKIALTDSVGVEMRHPSFRDIMRVYSKANTDTVMDLVKSCIKAVYDRNSYTEIDDSNKADLDTFVEDLTKEQFDKIENFFGTMPTLVQVVDSVCPKCEANNHVEVRGLENFFA
jgi:hypothetical protein